MRSLLPLIALLSACSFPQLAERAPYAADANGQCATGEIAVVATPMSRTAKAQAKGVQETITCVQPGAPVLAFVKSTQACGTKLELRPTTDALAQAAVNDEARACRAARLSVPKAGKVATRTGEAKFGAGRNEIGVGDERTSAKKATARRERGEGRGKLGAGKAGRMAPEVDVSATAEGVESVGDSRI